MKLIGSLKDKVSNAETLEEKRDIIAQAGIELTDDELEDVTGGVLQSDNLIVGAARIPFACRDPKCSNIFYIKVGVSIAKCPNCNRAYEIKG